MELEAYLYDKIVPLLRSWEAPDIYAISFYVDTNEANVYQGVPNFPEFSVGYNTEADCNNAPPLSEKRWNFARWPQNNVLLIDAYEAQDGAAFLLGWYRAQGLENLGWEDPDGQYDEEMNYIGKGPVGYYELLCAVSNVARRIQTEGIVREKFGNIPILVHSLENCWYVEEATRNANPNGEADTFLAYLQQDPFEFPNDLDESEPQSPDSDEFRKTIAAFLDRLVDPLAELEAEAEKLDPQKLGDSVLSLLDRLDNDDADKKRKKK